MKIRIYSTKCIILITKVHFIPLIAEPMDFPVVANPLNFVPWVWKRSF